MNKTKNKFIVLNSATLVSWPEKKGQINAILRDHVDTVAADLF